MDNNGAVIQYPPNPNSSEAISTATSPQTVLPATAPTPPPTSDGGIIVVPASATNSNQGTNLAPAPPILPPRNSNETAEQYLAKFRDTPTQQVNTTPPQELNKSDA